MVKLVYKKPGILIVADQPTPGATAKRIVQQTQDTANLT
jgi:hypothetical protein